MTDFSVVGKPVLKVDSLSLACGAARYTADFEVKNPLHLVFFYSPHAHAEILSIDDGPARGMEGVVDVFHSGNTRFTVNTDTKFHFIICQLECWSPFCRDGAGGICHADGLCV